MDYLELAAIQRAQAALAIAGARPENDFSLARMIAAHYDQSWGTARSHEFDIVAALDKKHGVADRRGEHVPDDALLTRDLVAGSAAAGGHLTSSLVGGYLAALQPVSVALRLGATIMPVAPSSSVALPSATNPVSVGWLGSEATGPAESQPLLGQTAVVPKIVAGFAEVSRQLLLQSNAEEVIRLEFRNAAAAALDAAILAGSGALGQPLGIVNTAGIGAFTGAALSQAQLRNAQADVGVRSGVVNPGSQGYVTTPAVAEILATRPRFASGTVVALWEGSSADGVVEGVRAMSTTGMPAATLIYGDFSQIFIAQWAGGLVIEIDPYTKFTAGVVGVRLLMAVDIAIRPSCFSVATGVS